MNIREIIASELGHEVDDLTSFDALDSLEFIALMVELDKQGFKVPEIKWPHINTVGELIASAQC